MTTRTHVYELYSATNDKVMATFWWDGKKVDSDNPQYLKSAGERYPDNYSIKDGIKFLDALPSAYRNGYLSIRRKDDE